MTGVGWLAGDAEQKQDHRSPGMKGTGRRDVDVERNVTEPTPPWKEVIYQYSQETTFHGVRYITLQTKYTIRRILWFLVVCTAITLFGYLMVQRLILFFNYPKSVILEVTYYNSLIFPAVTICNQNLFRLSRVQEYGLYDLISSELDNLEATSSSTVSLDEYTRRELGCLRDDYEADVTYDQYVEVTLEGCKYLCQYLHDETCSIILYQPWNRSCILQPLQAIDFSYEPNVNCTPTLTYRRRRKTDNSSVVCDFESDCSLSQTHNDQEDWRVLEARLDQTGQRDHTTMSGEGHVFYILETGRAYQSQARLYTPHKTTGGLCIQLSVWLRGGSELRVSVRGEDYVEIPLNMSTAWDGNWQWRYAELPVGIHQILIDGLSAPAAVSGILMDDVYIKPCEQFHLECKTTRSGSDYFGTTSVCQSNRTCFLWTDVASIVSGLEMPFGTLEYNWNFCRTATVESNASRSLPFGAVPVTPWCFTTAGFELCDIPYCECSSSADVFSCDDGQCFPAALQCDSVAHCEDESDEVSQCERLRHVSCQFERGFICGYNTTSINPGDGVIWRRMEDNYFFQTTHSPTAEGFYMQIDTEYARSKMVIPMSTPSFDSSIPHCLSFEYKLNSTDESMSPNLTVYIRSSSYIFANQRLWFASEKGWGVANVSVPVVYPPGLSKLDFVGILGDASTTLINVANVEFTDAPCPLPVPQTCEAGQFPCATGGCIQRDRLCNGFADCMDESDERQPCETSVDCAFDADKPNNCGYISRSSFGDFHWSSRSSIYEGEEISFVAAQYDDTRPYANAKSILVSPEATVTIPTCLTFLYFMRSNLVLMTTNASHTSTLAYWDVDGGMALHKAYIDLPIGQYQLVWEVRYGLDTIEAADGEYGTERAAIDDVSLHHGACSELRRQWNVLECDFRHEALCGWGSSNHGPVRETRVKRGDTYLIATTAPSHDGAHPSLSSPVVAVVRRTCMVLVFKCERCGDSFQMNVTLKETGQPAQIARLMDLTPDVELTRILEIPSGLYCVSFLTLISSGTLLIRSVSLRDEVSSACDIPVNLAKRKNTWQTGETDDGYSIGGSYLAVDDNTSPSFEAGSCSSTWGEVTVWWAVDLVHSYKVETINITSRDTHAEGLANFTVVVSYLEPVIGTPLNLDSTEYQRCVRYNGTPPAGITFTVTCAPRAIGRYVYIYLPTPQNLTLCEVRIYGRLNLAGYRPTEQVGLRGDPPERAVDGNPNPDSEANSCSRTNQHDNAWWSVDLGQKYEIIIVAVINRRTQGRLEDFRVVASNRGPRVEDPRDLDGPEYQRCGQYDGIPPAGIATAIHCLANVQVAELTWETETALIPSQSFVPSQVTSIVAESPNESYINVSIGGGSISDDSMNPAEDGPIEFWMHPTLTTPTYTGELEGLTQKEVQSIYGNYSPNPTGSTSLQTPVTDDIETFYRHAGHENLDLIYSCLWNGVACPNMSFAPVMVDLGQCYTFNSDNQDIFMANKTGAGFGLSLVLNIEEYEYMSGPTTDAGVKVYLHEQDDIPQIKNLGFAVSPGSHSLVAAKCNVFSSLPHPYGICGESGLTMYPPDTTYTHSRCSEQCASEYADQECKCLDAYMPGVVPNCNLTRYLECIMRIEYVTGFRNPNCTCIDACEVRSYGVDLSYAALSSQNVESLLHSNIDDLKRKYHRALEIQQRVKITNIQRTVESLRNITISLKAYVWLLFNSSGSSLERVDEALERIVKVAKADVLSMKETVDKAMDAYTSEISSTVDPLVSNIEHIEDVLKYMEYRIVAKDDGHGEYAFEVARMYLDMLYSTLKKMSYIESDLQTDADQLRWAADFLWKNRSGADICIKLFTSEAEACEDLESELDEALQNWDHYMLDASTEQWRIATQESVRQRLRNMPSISRCVEEYRNVLNGALNVLRETRGSIDEILEGKFNFDYDWVLNNVKEDLEYLKSNISWLESVLLTYSKNLTTKLELSNALTKAEVYGIGQTLESVLTAMKTYALNRLETTIGETASNIIGWIHNGLEAMHSLVPYFSSRYIENDARQLNIWRQPKADLDTSEILHYKFPETETWRSWPRERTFTDLLDQQEDVAIIQSIITIYTDELYSQLHTVRTKISSAMKDITAGMEVFVADLSEFRTKSLIDENFITSNFMTMDVYFPALKCESVTQLKSYGPMNFLSEVGGYMGLLIGASALTLCEILDLLVYNLVLRCLKIGRERKLLENHCDRCSAAQDRTNEYADFFNRAYENPRHNESDHHKHGSGFSPKNNDFHRQPRVGLYNQRRDAYESGDRFHGREYETFHEYFHWD